MGYYTNYTVETDSDSRQAAIDAAADLIERSKYGVDLTGATNFEVEAKWYEWEEDVSAVSKDHPGVIFYIYGKGEESGDIWKAWAHNGTVFQSQAEMTFHEPPWLAQAKNDAGAVVASLHEAEKEAAMQAELAELARLKAKYEGK